MRPRWCFWNQCFLGDCLKEILTQAAAQLPFLFLQKKSLVVGDWEYWTLIFENPAGKSVCTCKSYSTSRKQESVTRIAVKSAASLMFTVHFSDHSVEWSARSYLPNQERNQSKAYDYHCTLVSFEDLGRECSDKLKLMVGECVFSAWRIVVSSTNRRRGKVKKGSTFPGIVGRDTGKSQTSWFQPVFSLLPPETWTAVTIVRRHPEIPNEVIPTRLFSATARNMNCSHHRQTGSLKFYSSSTITVSGYLNLNPRAWTNCSRMELWNRSNIYLVIYSSPGNRIR
jgi:hypothetical protein